MASGAMRIPDPTPFDPEVIPEQVALIHGGGAVRMTWHDGTVATLPTERLRLRCRCAWCTRDRALGRFPTRFEGVTLSRIEPMGGYAVNLVFSDGHARGIYPWVYLRALADETSAALQPADRAA